jgi:hypothetical protein
MESKVVARVLSARPAQCASQNGADVWLFGIVLEQDIQGHSRWIIETTDAAVISHLRTAYADKSLTAIDATLLTDPAVNAVD